MGCKNELKEEIFEELKDFIVANVENDLFEVASIFNSFCVADDTYLENSEFV